MIRLEDCFDDEHLSDGEERLDISCELNNDGKDLREYDEDFVVDYRHLLLYR